MLRVYAKNMAEHRQNMFRVGIDLGHRNTDRRRGDPVRLLRIRRFAQVFWDTGRYDGLGTASVVLAKGDGPARRGHAARTLAQGCRRRPEAVALRRGVSPPVLPALVRHLRKRSGWIRRFSMSATEPSNHNVMSWARASDFAHATAPNSAGSTPSRRRIAWIAWRSGFQARPPGDVARGVRNRPGAGQRALALYGGHLPGRVPAEQDRRRSPDRVPAVALVELSLRSEGLPALGIQRLDGRSDQRPRQHRGDGWQRVSGEGRSIEFASLGADAQRTGGLRSASGCWSRSSVRSKPRSARGSRHWWIRPGGAFEIASQVVRSYTDYSKDPRVLYAARREVIEADARPGCLAARDSPDESPEHSEVAGNCALDVFGWAEPARASRSTARRRRWRPTACFIDNVAPSKEGALVVEAQSEKGRKTVVRKYQLISTSP